MANQHGGPRPNSGRPKGSSDKRVIALREITDEAIAAGVLPIELLLKYMRHYDSQALQVQAELDETLTQLRNTKLSDAAVELLDEAASKLLSFDAIVDRIYTFASGAATYVHPKLAHMQVTGQGGGPVRIAVDAIPPEDRRRMFYEEMKSIKAGNAPTIVLEDLRKKAGRDGKS